MPCNEIDPGQPKNHYAEMHATAKAEESLINRLDIHHHGFVTPEELKLAEGNKGLSAADRHLAAVMLQTQEELRYERLGVLPSLHLGEPAFSMSVTDRPPPKAEVQAKDKDQSNHISVDDVKRFDAAVSREQSLLNGMDQLKTGLGNDIMAKYAKAEPGKRLLPSEVWSAVADLSKKADLSPVEREELSILKYTQAQMREMYPHEKEPADHNSQAHKDYMKALQAIPISKSDLGMNASYVETTDLYNPAINYIASGLYQEQQIPMVPQVTHGDGSPPMAPPTPRK